MTVFLTISQFQKRFNFFRFLSQNMKLKNITCLPITSSKVMWKQKLDIVPKGTRCGFQIYFPRKKNNLFFSISIKNVLFSLERSDTLTNLPFENIMAW